jgi:mono/diheme cytochrome c family protein
MIQLDQTRKLINMRLKNHGKYVGRTLLGLIAMVIALAACSEKTSSITLDSLPPGDAAHGGILFTESINGTPPCSACHTDKSIPAGPSLTNYRDEAGDRSNLSADEYTLDSIVRPAKTILRGYSNTMYAGYGEKLSAQDIADLIAYMLD